MRPKSHRGMADCRGQSEPEGEAFAAPCGCFAPANGQIRQPSADLQFTRCCDYFPSPGILAPESFACALWLRFATAAETLAVTGRRQGAVVVLSGRTPALPPPGGVQCRSSEPIRCRPELHWPRAAHACESAPPIAVKSAAFVVLRPTPVTHTTAHLGRPKDLRRTGGRGIA